MFSIGNEDLMDLRPLLQQTMLQQTKPEICLGVHQTKPTCQDLRRSVEIDKPHSPAQICFNQDGEAICMGLNHLTRPMVYIQRSLLSGFRSRLPTIWISLFFFLHRRLVLFPVMCHGVEMC
jgi:hypothetical protein